MLVKRTETSSEINTCERVIKCKHASLYSRLLGALSGKFKINDISI